MLYLYLDKNQLRLLFLKKTILKQYEVNVFDKTYEVDLLQDGKITNVDFLASAIKEALTNITTSGDKDVFLVLPQESFTFLKADVPADIAQSAIGPFIKDKVRTTLPISIENSFCDYFVKDSGGQKQVSFYAIDTEQIEKLVETFKLLGLKLVWLLPDSLAIFKLFEKTLRKEKKEHIFYVSYASKLLSGYLYDTGGLLSEKKWSHALINDEPVEKILKAQTDSLEKDGKKLNRIILSGSASESVRQDTFTKEVGVWTNPLKRIIPNFYEHYMKQLVVSSNQPFPLLQFDVCFGAFIFEQENREFQILKKPMKKKKGGVKLPSFSFGPWLKYGFIVILSSIITIGVIVGLSKFKDQIKLPSLPNFQLTKPQTPSPTMPPTITPAPKVNREEIKIKVLNGSGTAGKATEVKDLLSEKGYQEILTANADSFDYEETVVQFKKETKDAAQLLKKDLEDSGATFKDEVLEEDSASDIILIIGADFK